MCWGPLTHKQAQTSGYLFVVRDREYDDKIEGHSSIYMAKSYRVHIYARHERVRICEVSLHIIAYVVEWYTF